jgi:hypothetical protein
MQVITAGAGPFPMGMHPASYFNPRWDDKPFQTGHEAITAGAGPKHPAIITLIALSGNRAEFDKLLPFHSFPALKKR